MGRHISSSDFESGAFPMTRESVFELLNENITVREHRRITRESENRALFIMSSIFEMTGCVCWALAFTDGKLDEYDNCTDEVGTFTLYREQETVSFKAIRSTPESEFSIPYVNDYYFPVEFMWMDNGQWREIVNFKIAERRAEVETKRTLNAKLEFERTIERQRMIDSIKSKLTQEEIDFITVKFPLGKTNLDY